MTGRAATTAALGASCAPHSRPREASPDRRSLEGVEEPVAGQVLHGVALHPVGIQLFHTRNEVHDEDLKNKQQQEKRPLLLPCHKTLFPLPAIKSVLIPAQGPRESTSRPLSVHPVST